MLRACPHHGFTELTQVDTFYNWLNDNDQDSLNAAAGENLLRLNTTSRDIGVDCMEVDGNGLACGSSVSRWQWGELTQVDTFYNWLNDNDQDSLNAAAGENLLSKMTREALNIIKNKSKECYSRNKPNASRMNTTSRESVSKTDERIDKLADQLSTLVEIVSTKVVTPAPVKAVEETCVTCGGAHSWYNCPTTDNNQASVCATTSTYNQVNPLNRVSNQMTPPGFAPVQKNGQNRFNQNQVQGNNFNRGNNFHGTLPSNTIPNPKGEIKAITTRSGVAYEGPSIPTNPSSKRYFMPPSISNAAIDIREKVLTVSFIREKVISNRWATYTEEFGVLICYTHREGIVLGHKISKSGIEVDRAKVDVIAKLPYPTTVKGTLKKKGLRSSDLCCPSLELPSEFMCDARAQNSLQYTEKEMFAVVYAFEKFWPYLVLSKSIVYTDYSALKYLMNKQDAKPRLLQWVLLLQKFDITIRDKKGSESNLVEIII
ncbi:reverse transcriptase domain-containing protein [Tanacetum coccineum]